MKQRYRRSARYDENADKVLRFRNIEKPTQDALERLGIVTQAQLQSAVDRYGVEGLLARLSDAGYTPPKHEQWRILGAVRGKDWKVLLKELRVKK